MYNLAVGTLSVFSVMHAMSKADVFSWHGWQPDVDVLFFSLHAFVPYQLLFNKLTLCRFVVLSIIIM